MYKVNSHKDIATYFIFTAQNHLENYVLPKFGHCHLTILCTEATIQTLGKRAK